MSRFLLPPPDRNLILTGYTGPNQPALAGRIAERLKLPLVNLDAMLETRSGLALGELRETFGETRLKSLENEAISEVALRRGALLQVNGRTLINGENLERLQQTGPVICLVARLDAVLRRLHVAMGARYHNPQEREAALGTLRSEWSVRRKPDVLEVDTTNLSPEDIIEQVVRLWKETQLA